MKKLFAIVLCLVLAAGIAGCSKVTYRIGITIPSESPDGYAWSDEEISPHAKKITIHSSDELGDVEIILKPVEAKEENAYDEPVHIARGESVTLNAEKGAWFRIGIRMLENAVPGKVKFFEIKDIEVRISSEANTEYDSFVLQGTIIEIADGTMIVEPLEGSRELSACDTFAVPIENMMAFPEPQVGDRVEISYDGTIEETYPARLGQIFFIDVIKTGAGIEEKVDGLPDGSLAINIDGVTYYGPGFPVPVEPDESAIEYVEIPAGYGDAKITAFARLEEGKLIVCLIDGEWYQFYSLEALTSSQVNLDK